MLLMIQRNLVQKNILLLHNTNVSVAEGDSVVVNHEHESAAEGESDIGNYTKLSKSTVEKEGYLRMIQRNLLQKDIMILRMIQKSLLQTETVLL
mmetsp:Transcript_4741/g.6136  ORF Transcript_4741/g.6136 Transcript_4741/m.6136 type:complete len:94 (+) Transcript_4741:533-814(+)